LYFDACSSRPDTDACTKTSRDRSQLEITRVTFSSFDYLEQVAIA